MNIKTIVVSTVLACGVVGMMYSFEYKSERAAEQRLQRIEARLDRVVTSNDSLIDEMYQRDAAIGVLIDYVPDRISTEIKDSMWARFYERQTRKADMRFVLADSSVVISTWTHMQDRVWDIRRAEPIDSVKK